MTVSLNCIHYHPCTHCPCSCLQLTTFVERTFCTDTCEERDSWLEAIGVVSQKVKEREESALKRDSLAGNGSVPAAAKQQTRVCGGRGVHIGVWREGCAHGVC